jgi:hypothetical protein
MSPPTWCALRLAISCALLGSLGCGPMVLEPDAMSTDGSTTSEVSADDATSVGPPPVTTRGTSDDESTGPAADGTTSDVAGESETTGEPGPDLPPLPPDCDGDLLVSDVLQPEEVYIAGTLSEGACYLDALAHWSTPNDAVAGFDCYFDERGAKIRPTDGRLLYSNTFEGLLREFHCDTCPIDSTSEYPDNPLGNDFVLATPACDPDESTSLGHLVSPDGAIAYRCNGFLDTWYDERGAVVYDGAEPLLHLGHDGLALTTNSVLSLSTGAVVPIVGLPAGNPVTIRADSEDGFRVVMTTEQPELWHVSATGAATSLGIYPPIPAGYSPYGFIAALDGCGVLFQQGSGLEVFEDVILRRELGGTTDVVYTEATNPLVKLHISALVTGP